MWFQAHRETVTQRVFALTDDQRSALLHFLDLDPAAVGTSECPLPIIGDSSNRRRVDYEIAIPEHNIYRDRWERPIEYGSYDDYLNRRSCVRDVFDYPELEVQALRRFL